MQVCSCLVELFGLYVNSLIERTRLGNNVLILGLLYKILVSVYVEYNFKYLFSILTLCRVPLDS